MLTRRNFIKAGAAGAATLTALRIGCVWAADPEVIADPGYAYNALTEQDRSLLAALTPVILADALPADEGEAKLAIKEVVRGMDIGVTLLPAGSQAEMRQFFDLLENQLLPDWKDPAKVEQFLRQSQSWDDPSPEAQALQVGMTGLVQLTLASWYGNPRSWVATGYAGPPALY
jgi:hypothetical protein